MVSVGTSIVPPGPCPPPEDTPGASPAVTTSAGHSLNSRLCRVPGRPPWRKDMGAEWTRFPDRPPALYQGDQAVVPVLACRHLRFHVYDRITPSPRIDDMLRENSTVTLSPPFFGIGPKPRHDQADADHQRRGRREPSSGIALWRIRRVRNLRAAGKGEMSRKGRTEAFHAVEVPVDQRGPVIARYREAAGRVAGPGGSRSCLMPGIIRCPESTAIQAGNPDHRGRGEEPGVSACSAGPRGSDSGSAWSTLAQRCRRPAQRSLCAAGAEAVVAAGRMPAGGSVSLRRQATCGMAARRGSRHEC